nr:hypothetical protein [Propionicimonas sp.]
MGGWTVDPVTAKAAANGLAPAAELAGDSASALRGAAIAQDGAKWGTETGPRSFRSAFSDALWATRDDLATMQERLTSYVAGVRGAIQAFENSDDDAAARSQLDEAQLEQEARERAPEPPPIAWGGHVPQAY